MFQERHVAKNDSNRYSYDEITIALQLPQNPQLYCSYASVCNGPETCNFHNNLQSQNHR